MTVKVTDLPLTTGLSPLAVLYIVDPIDPLGPTSKQTTLAQVSSLVSPIASDSVRGSVKIGSGLSVDGNGVISATSVSGNAATVTNGVYTTGSYANPSWITSLAASKVGLGNVTNESKATMFASPTFTGTVSGVTAAMVGLGSVTNESKATMFTNPTFTGTITGITSTTVGLGNVTNESKSTMFTNPTFTGSVSGINATMVGLGNVTNESKATMFASPTFTGTVSGVTKTHVGLGSVENTALSSWTGSTSITTLGTVTTGSAPASDVYAWAKAATKPSYTATEVGLGNVTNESKATMFTSPAFTEIPTAPTATAGTNTTQIATTAFVSTAVSNLVASAPAALNTLNELATALGNDASFATTVSTAMGLKAPVESPTFTGTVTIPAGASISGYATSSGASLSNVAGMSFASGVAVDQFSTDGFFTANASNKVPVESAVKTYVDTGLGGRASLTSPTFNTSIDGSATFGAFASSSTLTVGFTGINSTNITNIATAATGNSYTKTVNIGTGGMGTTTINIGQVSNSTTFINGHVVLETVTSTGATGSGKIVFDSSPTLSSPSLTTPSLGVATATSINKMAITAPATSSTLAVADGKTFTVSNTITLAGTDSTTITLPSTTGTVALNNQIHYIGTTSVAINRASASLALTGITSIDGSAASVANSLTISTGLSGTSYNGGSAVTIAIDSTVTTLTGTQTLTNKRVTARVQTTASSATITPTADTCDMYTVTALATAATIAAPSGTPTDGQRLMLRIKSDASNRALTWTTSSGAYRALGIGALPSSTIANKTLYVGCIYNAQDSFWDVVSYSQQ